MKNKKRIMFVCLGNICRSPMAEFIFKKIASSHEYEFEVASSATSSEEYGNPVYPPAAEILARHSIICRGKRAVKFTKEDYAYYDLIVCMESRHIKSVERIVGGDPQGKLCRLLDFSDNPRDIADPWYTGDFEKAYDEIYTGCLALYKHLTASKN
jgi:Protein-tyrosine-phosphatase